jgi:hypothetical protein
MKKGRRSGKKVSTSLRLTTAGSTSTWPKSGKTVASRVRLPPTAHLQIQARAQQRHALVVERADRRVVEVVRADARVGQELEAGGAGPARPAPRPRRSARRSRCPAAGCSTSRSCSFLRAMIRSKLMPQRPWSSLAKRSWEKGMRISPSTPSPVDQAGPSQTWIPAAVPPVVVGQGPVVLGAGGVQREVGAGAPVVARIQVDDEAVGDDVLSRGGPAGPRCRRAPSPQCARPRRRRPVEGHQHLGALGGLGALDGVPLQKAV